jgi:hypothetical protein
MKIVQHILKTDVRRFRLLLTGSLLIVFAGVIFDGIRPATGADRALRETIGTASALLRLAEICLSFALVALVVHAHHLVGSDAFWMTRPIPASAILASKAVLLGTVMVVVPVLARAVLMSAYGVPPVDIAGVSLQMTLFWTLWLILLMSAAAITSNLAKFAFLIGGTLLALALVFAVMVTILMAGFANSISFPGSSEIDSRTHGIVLSVFILMAVAALLGVQYQTRSRVRAFAIGAAGTVVAFIAAWIWPWSMLAPRIHVPAWAAADSHLHLTADAASVEVTRDANWFEDIDERPIHSARARVVLAGIEPAWSATITLLSAVLQLEEQKRLVSETSLQTSQLSLGTEGSTLQSVLQPLLGVQLLIATSRQTEFAVPVFSVRGEQLRQVAPARGSYRGRFRVSLARHEIEGVLPLARGAKHQNGAYRFVVDRVRTDPTGISIIARESNAGSLFDRRPQYRFEFYLRNRHAGEAVQGMDRDLRGDMYLTRLLPFWVASEREQEGGFSARAVQIYFRPSYDAEGPSVELSDNWIEGAELVIVRTTQEGSVERTLEIQNFPLRSNSMK